MCSAALTWKASFYMIKAGFRKYVIPTLDVRWHGIYAF